MEMPEDMCGGYWWLHTASGSEIILVGYSIGKWLLSVHGEDQGPWLYLDEMLRERRDVVAMELVAPPQRRLDR